MSRPRRVLALASVTTLAVATLTALTSATTGTSSAASATGAFGSPTWAQFFPGFVSQSAPVATSVSGTPTVAVGDQNGVVHMFRLANGTAVGSGSGWATPGGKVLGALSTDGTRLYVPDSPSGRSTVLRAYNLSNGSAAWSANGCGSASGCMELSGMTVDPVGTIYTGGNAQSVYALVAGSGVWRWSYLSSDSTNATPAVADLYGNGQHEIVYADDQTPNSAVRPVAQSGGHLRIFNSSGRQICNANVTGGPAHPGSFDSSPAVDLAGGTPLIAVGTGASGASPNRVLVFDDTCQLQWTSPALPGATVGAPALADVNGNGQPLAVEEVASGSAGTPVVTELDLRHRVVVRQRTLTGCADFHPGTASSVVAADLDSDGVQDLFVPAGACGVYVLNGKTLATEAVLAAGTNTQNTPLVTVDPNGRVGVTIAGYTVNTTYPHGAGVVWHYQYDGYGQLGSLSWPEFHHDAGLTGVEPRTSASRPDVIPAGGVLNPGQSLYSSDAGTRITMQTDGNLVVLRGTKVVTSSRTNVAGSHLVVGSTVLQIVAANGRVVKVLWHGAISAPVSFMSSNAGHALLRANLGNEWSSDSTLYTL